MASTKCLSRREIAANITSSSRPTQPMTSGSIGSHRAFMGVCITACVCLMLTLYVGWRWYFESLKGRGTLIALDKRAEDKERELASLGLSLDAGKSDAGVPPPAQPKVTINEVAPAGTGMTNPPASKDSGVQPPVSVIKELPLQESSDEVVQAEALLKTYWETPSWQERVPMVADSERVAAEMKDFYVTQQGSDPVPGELISKARYEIDGTEILYFSYNSSRPTGSLEIAMRRGPEGKFLIDWESLTGYGEMSFEDFRSKRVDKPVFLRAYVRLFEYYNFEFSDSSQFICVKLTSQNGESSIYAYARKSTELARWLERDLASTGPSGFKGYTLKVSFPPNAQSNQCVNLDSIVATRWLILP